MVLIPKRLHVHQQISDHWQAGKGTNNQRSLCGDRRYVRDAGKAVAATHVDAIRAAHSLAAGPSIRQRGIGDLKVFQNVQHHRVSTFRRIPGNRLHVRSLIDLWVVTVEFYKHFNAAGKVRGGRQRFPR